MENNHRQNDDSVKLLRECDSGAKMAVSSFNEVMDKISDSKLKHLLEESREQHEKLGDEIHSRLIRHGSEEKDPNPMAKSMSWLKTNVKMTVNDSDSTVAGLITDGCNMGVKSLHKYLNQYQAADSDSKNLCKRLASAEESLARELSSYL